MVSYFYVRPTSKRWFLKIVQVTMKHVPCRNPRRLYIHLAFTYSVGPSSVVRSKLGPAPPFPPMKVLEVQWSRALSLVCEVALVLIRMNSKRSAGRIKGSGLQRCSVDETLAPSGGGGGRQKGCLRGTRWPRDTGAKGRQHRQRQRRVDEEKAEEEESCRLRRHRV